MPDNMSRYAPPASIRGASLGSVRAQRKADKEVEELLQSESPYAAVKAFTLGLTTGTAMSYLAAAPSLVPQVLAAQKGIEQRAHLAHIFEEFADLDAEQSRQAAAGMHQYLSTPAPRGHVEQVAKALEGRGDGAHVVVGESSLRPVMASDVFLDRREAQKVLDIAQESFENAGKTAPGIVRSLGVVARKHAPYAAFAGLLAGAGNVALTRAKRKELQELRRYAREH